MKNNVVLFIVDQMNSDLISAYGHEHLSTPAIDRLVKRGANFHRAHCSQPICGPSRCSMMTGSLPSTNGAFLNQPPRSGLRLSDRAWLGKVMQSNGFKTAYFGKWHVAHPHTDTETHGFQTIEYTSGNGQDQLVTNACIDFIHQNREEPFFLVCSLNNPHNICEWARGDELPDADIPPPHSDSLPPLPKNVSFCPDEPSFIREFQISNPRVFPTHDWSRKEWQEYLWAYYRLVEKADEQIGKIMHAIDTSDYHNNTAIVFLSDHGDGAAAHGWNQKSVLFKECTSVPLIVCPAKEHGYQRSDHQELVNTGIDLLPTVAGIAGVRVESDQQLLLGSSVTPLMLSGDQPWRDYIGIEMTLGVRDQPFGVSGRALYFDNFKYEHYTDDTGAVWEMLFDHESDPGELLNIANSEAHTEALKAARAKLVLWCGYHSDPYIGNLHSIK
ncbi:MAG: sulfatase-like hydrolase/transferase [Opitutales bacterium]|nr:sulfatase-like hydrolase/transferase [Opitutales bacterium]